MKQTNRKADLPLLLLAVVLIFLIVCPVGMIFAKAVMQNGRLDFSPAVQTLLNPENAHMIGNSLLLGVLVVLLSTLIAAPLAYLFSRTKFARYRVFDILFMIPFMTPPYIASMGWILFMQKKGLLQQLIPAAAGCEKIFFTLGGLVLVMSLHVFPFMLTMLKNAMLNIPSSLEEAGAVFGAGFSARMRKIFLPLLSGNYAIGALLVFVKTLSEYGTPSTLGKRIGFEVFTTEIHRHATVAPIDFGSSATLSSVLVGICLCLWMLQNSVIKYSMLSAKMKVLFRKLPVRPGANPLSAWAKAAGASPPSHAKKHPGTDCSVPGCPAYLPVSSQPDPLPETPQPGPWYQPRRRCSGSPAHLRCARSSARCPAPGR